MTILRAIHRYAESGAGRVKALSGEFEGFLRLRIGNQRVFFKETADTVRIYGVVDRGAAYRSPHNFSSSVGGTGEFFWSAEG